jgi:hypothetical protein
MDPTIDSAKAYMGLLLKELNSRKEDLYRHEIYPEAVARLKRPGIGGDGQGLIERELRLWLESDDLQKRLLAIELIGDLGVSSLRSELEVLRENETFATRCTAALSKLGITHWTCYNALICLHDWLPETDQEVFDSLESYQGPPSEFPMHVVIGGELSRMLETWIAGKLDPNLRTRLIGCLESLAKDGNDAIRNVLEVSVFEGNEEDLRFKASVLPVLGPVTKRLIARNKRTGPN